MSGGLIDKVTTILVDVSADVNASSSVQMPDWAVFVGLYFPTSTAGVWKLEVSTDNSTFVPVIDLSDGADLEIVDTNATPCFVDVSDYLRAIGKNHYFRVNSVANQAADRSITVTMRG